ncbi:hypothetical protein N7U66_20695 [Lacinutrix neustonica]|uniref:Uncharacterized protein n=1 Tax=Lacinutrix neustonica TaxID=2980107 RepID=A0A9E8MXM8_9FLAO|nr:hypothetical protein [Lacinutrix neustonica]WAC02160.1 hypothetical protein N7U66_20695 [Lacinutrix neustonica]
MQKTKKYIKILIFVISILGFLDLIINPKPFHFLGTKLNFATSLLSIIGLLILTLKEILNDRFQISEKILSGIKIGILILFLIYLNVFLKWFTFVGYVDYIVVTYLTLPIIFILRDIIPDTIKSKNLTLIGFLLLLPTLIYFGLFYEAYEDYSSDGMPIMFVHQRIRNWICYIGIALILTSIIRKKTNHNTV